jgi:hypothetical protein
MLGRYKERLVAKRGRTAKSTFLKNRLWQYVSTGDIVWRTGVTTPALNFRFPGQFPRIVGLAAKVSHKPTAVMRHFFGRALSLLREEEFDLEF